MAKHSFDSRVPPEIVGGRRYAVGLPRFGDRNEGSLAIRATAEGGWRLTLPAGVSVAVAPVDVNGESPGNPPVTVRRSEDGPDRAHHTMALRAGWYFVTLGSADEAADLDVAIEPR